MTELTARPGHWPSPLDTDAVFSQPGAPQYPQRAAGGLYWIQSLPEQGGRQALMRQSETGAPEVVTPAELNIRTQVHEYGGCCHWLNDTHCWFVNFSDQRLYRQSLGEATATPLTRAPTQGDGWMLADLVLHPAGRWLLAIGEQKPAAEPSAGGLPVSGSENRNALVAVDLSAEGPDAAVIELLSGRDFYAAPAVSTDGQTLACLCWDHPAMPWQSAELLEVAFDALLEAALSRRSLAADAVRSIDGGGDAAACQPVYQGAQRLVYACDRAQPLPASTPTRQQAQGEIADAHDYWNIHVAEDGAGQRLTHHGVEYGAAHWVFGQRRISPVTDTRLLTIGTAESGEILQLVDANGQATMVPGADKYVGFSQLSAPRDGEVLLVATAADRGASILAFNADTGTLTTLLAAEPVLATADVSRAEPFRARSRDGNTVHSWFYPPVNRQFPEKLTSPPPVMVLVHGGPTSRAAAAFDPARQFWTTRGVAVLDVNHRGSTGFGRRYRAALDGQWGVRDVDDVVDSLQAAAERQLIDPTRVFIRGGSAGGYVVLAALTRYPRVFLAGACYYGIGNLATLARATHKFESRYLDSLLGEPFSSEEDESSVYYTRSPIHYMDAVRSPMILFQGTDDKVVPPEVSREVVQLLKDRGIPHRYVEYPGEGHGFRMAANRIDALNTEAAFLLDVMDASA